MEKINVLFDIWKLLWPVMWTLHRKTI